MQYIPVYSEGPRTDISIRTSSPKKMVTRPAMDHSFRNTWIVVSNLVRMQLSKAQLLAPQEFGLETGRLVQLLAMHAEGLVKETLVRSVYPSYDTASALRQQSLDACLSKLIQRARKRFHPFGLTISYSKENKRWVLIPIEFQIV